MYLLLNRVSHARSVLKQFLFGYTRSQLSDFAFNTYKLYSFLALLNNENRIEIRKVVYNKKRNKSNQRLYFLVLKELTIRFPVENKVLSNTKDIYNRLPERLVVHW